MNLRRKLALAAVSAAVLSLFGVSAAVAAPAPKPSNQGAPIAALAACATPANAHNAFVEQRTRTSNDARFYTNSAAWADLECGTSYVTVPGGRQAAVTVEVDAEVLCLSSVSNSEWCLGQVLVGNTVAQPSAPEATGSFAWASSTTDAAEWESHAFTRSIQLRCPDTVRLCSWPVKVQVRNHAAGLNFRVDDSTVHVTAVYQ